MKTQNKFIGRLAMWWLKDKTRKFSFTYEETVYETDVVDQTYVRHYIINLQEAVEAEIARLTEEYNL